MKRFLMLLCGAGIWMVGAVSCGHRAEETERIPRVKTDTVRRVGEGETLQLPGRVKAAEDIHVAFRVPGVIAQVNVSEGERVRRGELLARLDPADYEVQLQAVRAEHAGVKGEAERVMGLYKDSVTTPNDNDRARYGLQQMEAKLRHAEDQLAYTRLTAPFDGRVQRVMGHAHEAVSAGMPVMTLVGDGRPEVEVSLPAADYVERHRFGECSCTFDVWPGRRFLLTPAGFSPKANSNQLYTLRLVMNEDSLPVPTPGMNTWVTISLEPDADGELLSVPTGALFTREGKTWVYVVDKKRGTVGAREVELVTLRSNGRSLVRSQAIKPGEEIVTSGVHILREGDKVEPLSAPSETNVGGLL